jgi:hypothetical protein
MVILANTKNLELPFGVVLPEVNGLMIEFNGHTASYMTIEEYYEECLDDRDMWVSLDERNKAIANNSVWQVHWYPSTPNSSWKVLASSLEVALKAVRECFE